MSEFVTFVYDEYRKWWNYEGRGVSLYYEPSYQVVAKRRPAPDPVWRSVKARRKRNEETGAPL